MKMIVIDEPYNKGYIRGKLDSYSHVEDHYFIFINFIADFGDTTISKCLKHSIAVQTNTLYVEQKLLRLSEKINSPTDRHIIFTIISCNT